MAAPELTVEDYLRANAVQHVLDERRRQIEKGYTVKQDAENFRELLVKNVAMALAALEAYDAVH